MDRFWSKVVKSEGCWIWSAAVSSNKYGSFMFQGKIRQAHRVAWTLTNGESFGESHGSAKLSASMVDEIRKNRGLQTVRKLASVYGVSKSLISAIHVGKIWNHRG